MKVTVQASKLVKPSYGTGGVAPPATDEIMPLSVFDTVNFDTYVSAVFAFRPPAPPDAVLEEGLARALAEYRELAGRWGEDASGGRAIVLNDAGARLVLATADAAIVGDPAPFEPTPELLSLRPSEDGAEELVLLQLTRFACGSLVLGFTAHHLVTDARAFGNFMLAWGQASRGAPVAPPPVHDRVGLFAPRDPPRVEFEHRGVEFVPAKQRPDGPYMDAAAAAEVVVQKVHFSKEFVSRLKAEASAPAAARPYSTFQCVVAQLWRAITKARGLGGDEATHVRIAVDGRARMSPRVPDGYTGNVVLWAFPRAAARELTASPLGFAVERIHRAVQRLDDAYFRSFIDFATSGAVAEEGLAASADAAETVLCPDIEVDSWLRVPFYELDFGGGARPYFFMPTYLPVEGVLILLPSFVGDGSVDAYVPLLSHNVDAFNSCCYSLHLE